jgi:protein gp37
MSTNSSIEWTESTWNPLTGCNKVSPGCKNCYAERMARRLKAMGSPNYENGFRLTLHEHALEIPLSWKRPQMIFVNSMSDLFHEDVPFEFIMKVFKVMHEASWHIFQILTKRSTRLSELAEELSWPENVWMGVSVETNDYSYRIQNLLSTTASTKFISFEPLLGPISQLHLDGIDWVIVGGESGPRARSIDEEWVLSIRDQCISQGIPFFFKQWGGVQKKKNGRVLQGRTWDQLPAYSEAFT